MKHPKTWQEYLELQFSIIITGPTILYVYIWRQTVQISALQWDSWTPLRRSQKILNTMQSFHPQILTMGSITHGQEYLRSSEKHYLKIWKFVSTWLGGLGKKMTTSCSFSPICCLNQIIMTTVIYLMWGFVYLYTVNSILYL